MTWQDRTSIQPGDRVAYSAAFCRSTGQQTGDTPFMRGTVIGVTKLGEITLAKVDWHDGEEPRNVAAKNLSRITDKGILDR